MRRRKAAEEERGLRKIWEATLLDLVWWLMDGSRRDGWKTDCIFDTPKVKGEKWQWIQKFVLI